MSLVQSVETKLHDLWAALEAEDHHLAEQAKAVLDEQRATAPKLEAEAETDAEQVAQTAATEGLVPAEQKAVASGVTLAEDAGRDVAAAVEGSAKTEAATEPTA